ncbi:MAG: hypothetical protein WC412_08320 [Candidatus Omnitrophota bacterium]|jgi:hypothetical protein
MKNKNYWNFAITISLAVHLGVITMSYSAITKNIPISDKKEIKEIKITVKEVVKNGVSSTIGKGVHDNDEKKFPPPPYIKNLIGKLLVNNDKNISLSKAQIFEKDINGIVIYDKLDNAALKRNPSYMSYYNGLRSKLYESSRKSYKGKSIGEVSLSFVLLRDGTLERVKGEGANQQLIDLAIRIVKESAPFTSFPEDLKGQSCQFGISILFKNN